MPEKRRREATFWWMVVGICAIPVMARISSEGLAESPVFITWLRGSVGIIISIAVGHSIIRMGEPDEEALSRKEAGYLYVNPFETYHRQRRAALLLGFGILLPILIIAGAAGKFHDFGGPVLLPIVFIGPGLYLRDFLIAILPDAPVDQNNRED